jgi:hypothetical protein
LLFKGERPRADGRGGMSASLRRTLRVPLPVEILGTGGDPRFLGYLGNVSASGLFVQCARPRTPGTRLALRFRIPGRAEPIVCSEAEVIWTRGYGGRSGPAPGMGMRICALSSEAQSVLQCFCGDTPATEPPDYSVAIVV